MRSAHVHTFIYYDSAGHKISHLHREFLAKRIISHTSAVVFHSWKSLEDAIFCINAAPRHPRISNENIKRRACWLLDRIVTITHLHTDACIVFHTATCTPSCNNCSSCTAVLSSPCNTFLWVWIWTNHKGRPNDRCNAFYLVLTCNRNPLGKLACEWYPNVRLAICKMKEKPK